MMAAVTSGIGTVIGWVGSVIGEMVNETGELTTLLPLFAIGIAVSAVFLGVKVIRSVVWGA